MELSWLVVSDPPHDEVDVGSAAGLLGLNSAEMRMKANYGAPEIWLALADEREAADAVEELRGFGLSTSVVEARGLLSTPGPSPAASFSFGESGFVARYTDGDVELPFDVPVHAVFCKPPAGFRSQTSPRDGSTVGRTTTGVLLATRGGASHQLLKAEALELMSSVDLYTHSEGVLSRVSIAQDLVDFSGLEALKQPSAGANMGVCIAECQRRFEQFTLDARLENVRPRQRASVGSAGAEADNRRLYSFGTLGLGQLLEAVSPELKAITQYELGSRLSCLMHIGPNGGFE